MSSGTIPMSPGARLLPETANWSGSAPAVGVSTDDSRRWQESLAGFYKRVRTGVKGRRKHYYYQRIKERMAKIVPPGARVLDIGCGHGDLLTHLKPSVGVGVDFDQRVIEEASEAHPTHRFVHMRGEDVASLGEKFDYVLICQSLGEIYDLRRLFQAIHSVCHARTRLVIVHYNRVWQPALKFMEWIGLKNPSPEQNWAPADEVTHLLDLSQFETIRTFGMTLAPLYVPGVSAVVNRFLGNLPILNRFGVNYFVVARSVKSEVLQQHKTNSVSIVVPARNESGHIQPLLDRIPCMTPEQEVIFVEGNSTDDTWDVIQAAVKQYNGPFRVSCMQQEGQGKGDAVRKGFAAATGDVLMILDADISVPPEELTSFYDAIASGKGEFINGSRMVYLMDKKAMRFLNLLGNKAFGWMFTYLLSQRFRDTLCGTKVLTREDYERLTANRKYFGDFDPFGDFDLLFGAAKMNLKILDVPVHYKARTYGETNISRFRHGLILLRMCAFAARKLKFV